MRRVRKNTDFWSVLRQNSVFQQFESSIKQKTITGTDLRSLRFNFFFYDFYLNQLNLMVLKKVVHINLTIFIYNFAECWRFLLHFSPGFVIRRLKLRFDLVFSRILEVFSSGNAMPQIPSWFSLSSFWFSLTSYKDVFGDFSSCFSFPQFR